MQDDRIKLDLGIVTFFLIIACMSLYFYLYKHPIITYYKNLQINRLALFKIYLPDFIIFISLILIYILILIVAMFIVFFKKIEINNDFFMSFFFPLFGFFTKSMILAEIYVKIDFFTIIYDNLAFFTFILLGPMIILIKLFVIKIFKLNNIGADNV